MSDSATNSDEFKPHHDKKKSLHKPRFSIDLSLELERQLENESQPSTPAFELSPVPPSSSVYTQDSATSGGAFGRGESLDPQILASIVSQLRQNLSEITKERDGLLEMLAKSNGNEAVLQDALQLLTEKSTAMEEELQEARRKQKDDEEAISMLRTKVEESRRGLMRLQTETRRMSAAPSAIDMNRVASFGGTTSKAAKRASFTPLTGSYNYSAPPMPGRGHRRVSSISDSGMNSRHSLTPGGDIFDGRSPVPSPNGQVLFADPTSGGHPPVSSRRFSGFFGRPSSSPPNQDGNSMYSYDPVAAELEALRRELQGVKDELDEAKVELSESIEAKEASETCVQALREFIAEHNVGVTSDNNQQHQRHSTTSSVSSDIPLEPDTARRGWGFKLWKGDSNGGGNSPIITAPTPTSAAPPTPAPIITAGLARKMGGFFSGRSASVSSTASSLAPPPPLQQKEHSPTASPAPSISLSDEDDSLDLTEPVSPSDIIVGPVPVMVRGSMSSASSSGGVTKNYSAMAAAAEQEKSRYTPIAVHEVAL